MTRSSRRLGVVGTAVLGLVAPVLVATPAYASSTANEVVYTTDADRDGLYSIVLRDLTSRVGRTVVPEDEVNEWLYDEPELSPDGARIAFSTDRGSATFDEGIAIVDRNGGGFRRLTNLTPSTGDQPYTYDVSAAFSPDGSRILFTRVTYDDRVVPARTTTALWTVPTAGGTATAVAGAGDGYTGDWSPDGRKIVFAALPANTEADSGPITVINTDGTGRTPLGPIGLMPAWSPDGSTIAFATVTERFTVRDAAGNFVAQEDTSKIATVPATGGTPRILNVTKPTAARSVAEYPTWTPDGEGIVYDVFGYSATDDFPPGDLWAVDRLGVRAGRVTAGPADDAQADVHGPKPTPVASGVAATFTPVTPKRVLDTRYGTGARTGKVVGGESITLPVRGLQTAQGPVPATATAVVLNLTVTGTTVPTDVRVFPTGTPVPNVSNVNLGSGQTVPNLVTVKIGDTGGINLRNTAGAAHLIADIAGWYAPDTTGVGFASVEPRRLLDTRKGVGAPAAEIGPAGFTDLKVTGTLPTADGGTTVVPADARAVVLNVTATEGTRETDVRVYPTPTDGSVPVVSNLNVKAGQSTPNLVTVAVGDGGRVRLRNLNGEVDLIADLAGYYSPTAPGRFVPVTPARFLDTRAGIGAPPIPVTAGAFADVTVRGTRAIPAGATAAVMNLTGTTVQSALTDVRAYPSTSAVPLVSNLNLTFGTTRANLAIVKIGTDGRVRLRNQAGSLNLLGDLAGYMVG